MWKKIGKRPRLALVLALAMAAAIGVLWQKLREPPPQIITLPTGEQFRFAGVTWGTNHVFGSMAARLVNQIPLAQASFVRTHAGKLLGQISSSRTTEPSLCVWFQALGTNAPLAGPSSPTFIFAKLVDEHGVEAGTREVTMNPSGVCSFGCFPAVPRRSPVLQLRLYQADVQQRVTGEIGRVKFPNPLYGRFPQWKQEPVPATKMAGDLEVRLENLTTHIVENGGQTGIFQPSHGGEELRTAFEVALHSPRGTNEGWVIHSAQLSDATGNILRDPFFGGPLNQRGNLTSIRGTLWPDEAAWRLKLELKRATGYAPQELVTFKNVPVPKVGTTNSTPMTNMVGDVPVVLRELVRNPDNAINMMIGMFGGTRIRVELPTHPDGFALDFVEITTDTREKPVKYGETWRSPFDRAVLLKSIPASVQTMDITWLVQKTRSVEFLVKPPKPE